MCLIPLVCIYRYRVFSEYAIKMYNLKRKVQEISNTQIWYRRRYKMVYVGSKHWSYTIVAWAKSFNPNIYPFVPTSIPYFLLSVFIVFVYHFLLNQNLCLRVMVLVQWCHPLKVCKANFFLIYTWKCMASFTL